MAMKERVESQRACSPSPRPSPNCSRLAGHRPQRLDRGLFQDRPREARRRARGRTADPGDVYATLDDIIEALRKPSTRTASRSGSNTRRPPTAGSPPRLTSTPPRGPRDQRQVAAAAARLDRLQEQRPGGRVVAHLRPPLRAHGVVPIVSHAPQDADDDGKAAGSALIDGDQLVQVQEAPEGDANGPSGSSSRRSAALGTRT